MGDAKVDERMERKVVLGGFPNMDALQTRLVAAMKS